MKVVKGVFTMCSSVNGRATTSTWSGITRAMNRYKWFLFATATFLAQILIEACDTMIVGYWVRVRVTSTSKYSMHGVVIETLDELNAKLPPLPSAQLPKPNLAKGQQLISLPKAAPSEKRTEQSAKSFFPLHYTKALAVIAALVIPVFFSYFLLSTRF